MAPGSKAEKLHFSVRPWYLHTILNFSAQVQTDTTMLCCLFFSLQRQLLKRETAFIKCNLSSTCYLLIEMYINIYLESQIPNRHRAYMFNSIFLIVLRSLSMLMLLKKFCFLIKTHSANCLYCVNLHCHSHIFISNTFISNVRLTLAKNQANVKQHPEDEFLLFENYSHFSSCYHPKIMVHEN